MIILKRVFSEGFRAFFLSAGVFALLSVAVWTAWITTGGRFVLNVGSTPQDWHAHEMIFGYGGAALAGFFLTAVPNWTGGKAAPHRFIALVWGLWLAGRLALCLPALPPLLVAVADLSFIPVLAAQMLMQLIARPKLPQLIFVVILALFWTANLLCHLDWLGMTATLSQGLRSGLLVLAAMIVVMGGRITPGFTRNAMVAKGRETGLPYNPPPLAALSIIMALLTAVATLAGLPARVAGFMALLAGAAALLRVALWRGYWAWRQPILWSMHLSYALNALGFVLLGLAAFGTGTEIAALHVLGLGGIGGMTLAVMSRASLGHSGRPLVAPFGVAVAYALLPAAMAARWLASALPGFHDTGILLAGLLWCVAFALYLACLWPTWLRPRPPRAPVGRPPQ